MKCPRCQTADGTICKEGKENGQIVWTIYYCNACGFTWRDSEPEDTLDPNLRPAAFKLDPTRPADYPLIIPPRKS
jgi:vanillate/4-hydroxybenzoate decarboxylase subunit D